MHDFLSNLTAALLAIHAVFGCCWHHAHQDHQDRHECQVRTCVFLGPTKNNSHESAPQLDAPPAALAPCADLAAGDIVGEQPCFAPDALLPPLRLHLLCRVLLI